MWKPPERIRHSLPQDKIPTAEEASTSRLFSPLTLASGLTLADRSWVPAMVPWRASEDGFVTDDVLDWYGRFAEGEPSVLVIEATGIRDVPSGPLLRIGHDRFVPGLEKLVARVREKSGGRTRLFIQLIDFLRIRRRPPKEKFLGAHLVLTALHRKNLCRVLGESRWEGATDAEVRAVLLAASDEMLRDVLDSRELEALEFGARERVTDVEEPAIRDLPAVLPTLFANAATRAKQAGLDGIELHYAHAYTMASFLSALNTRADGYGQTLEGRARLPLLVYEAVRSEVGAGFTVGCRMLADEIIEGGSHVSDASFFATAFAKAGMDFISLSTGGKFEDAQQPKVGEAAYPYTGRSGFECMPTVFSDAAGPFSRQVAKHAQIRAAIRNAGFETPTATAGGIGTFVEAEAILQNEQADLIAAARQSLADPDWWKKLRKGRGNEIRRCIYTSYCEALDQRHRQVTCQLWDRQDLSEPGIPRSTDGRRRLLAPRWRG